MMLILLSPAKTFNQDRQIKFNLITQPHFREKTKQLRQYLKSFSVSDWQKTMGLSQTLSELNHQRLKTWSTQIEAPAISLFDGDVYQSFDIESLDQQRYSFLSQSILILSGLYGLLKPFDLIKPYRLEMGTSIDLDQYRSLYKFWGSSLQEYCIAYIKKHNLDYVINLASDEYSKALDLSSMPVSLIKPVFKDKKNGQYKVISFSAKRARGYMARYLIEQGAVSQSIMEKFSQNGYYFYGYKGSQIVYHRDV